MLWEMDLHEIFSDYNVECDFFRIYYCVYVKNSKMINHGYEYGYKSCWKFFIENNIWQFVTTSNEKLKIPSESNKWLIYKISLVLLNVCTVLYLL